MVSIVSILCLAHYCDTHGPTPMMVTEARPVNCDACSEDGAGRRPGTGNTVCSRLSGSISDKGKVVSSKAQTENIASPTTTITPTSPNTLHAPAGNTHVHRRDSSFRKTYDENDKKRAIPCENCALTLPRKTNEKNGRAVAPSSLSRGSAEKSRDAGSPVLRTRRPFRRFKPQSVVEPSPDASDSGDSVNDLGGRGHTASKRPKSVSSNASYVSTIPHTHYLDYTSTKEPLAPNSFSIIRQSCLRTLSCETLLPSTSLNVSSPTTPVISPYPSSSPPSTTSSGGPILFGDHFSGYTTAYVFRIPDPTARGRRRVYALMALSTQSERLAVQTFSILSTVFRELAAWIQGLAEQELERSENALSSPQLGDEERSYSATAFSYTSTSSFLSGRSGSSDGKFAGLSLRARGLAELVGLPDFFIELHARFVRLLIELSMMFGS